MKSLPIWIISIGIFLFTLSIINSFNAISFTQDFQRAEILATLSSISIITIGFILKQITPKSYEKVVLQGKEGFFIDELLNESTKLELAWGSNLILTATAASTMLIYWQDRTILKRGLISENIFKPGRICANSLKNGNLVSLANTKNYPGSYEFDTVIEGLPSLLVYPLGKKGYVIIGGWSIRCFTKSDEIWISGWSKKLMGIIDK